MSSFLIGWCPEGEAHPAHLDEQDGRTSRFPSTTPPVLLDGLPAGVPVSDRWVTEGVVGALEVKAGSGG